MDARIFKNKNLTNFDKFGKMPNQNSFSFVGKENVCTHLWICVNMETTWSWMQLNEWVNLCSFRSTVAPRWLLWIDFYENESWDNTTTNNCGLLQRDKMVQFKLQHCKQVCGLVEHVNMTSSSSFIVYFMFSWSYVTCCLVCRHNFSHVHGA